MNTSTNPKSTAIYVTIGYTGAILCMIALFIYGLVIQSQGLVVMASSIGALSGALWSATYASMKKKERASA